MNSTSSSSSSLLLTLYATVLVPVYSEWISKEDLCFLDTALCCHELRNRFLEMLTFCNITELVSDADKSFDWVIVRGLRVRKLKVSRLTPVINALIESSHLSSLHIDIQELVDHLSYIESKVHDILVYWLHKFDTSQLLIAGSAITELSDIEIDDNAILIIAACCPNLKRISASQTSEPFLLPLVDACQLDEINNCHLGSLVKRENCEWTYTCDLKRTSEVNDDETAVCLGEGKYYHMTSLRCRWNMTEEDSDLLIPLMPYLTDLSIKHDFVFNILSAAVENCRKLRKLHLVGSVDLSELELLLKSCDLRELRVSCNYNMKMDECIAVMSENCPLLEVCWLYHSVVESKSVMSEFFKKCHYLVEFSASRWPVDCVLPFAVNIDKIELENVAFVDKSRRRQRELAMPKGVSTGVLCAVLAQNPGLRSVCISNKVHDMSCVMASIVQSCPQLTSFDITAPWLHNASSLASLGRLMHLSSLLVRFTAGFTMETFSAMLENKSSSLLSLTLAGCGISCDMLAVISRLCPALTSLNLSNNPDIENADMMKLLSVCSKIDVLCMYGCSRITSEIVSSIKSPPMKSLNVHGTGITRSDLTVAFNGVEGFKYKV